MKTKDTRTVHSNHVPESANDLIERLEKETGRRIDDNDFDNPAMAGLFGAVARIMGQSTHQERDDVVAGYLVRHYCTPEHQRFLAERNRTARLLAMGFSPDC